MNTLPLLLGGAGLVLLAGQKQKVQPKVPAIPKGSSAEANAVRLAKLDKAVATRISRDQLKPIDGDPSTMTLEQLVQGSNIEEELARMQEEGASDEEIDLFLQKFIREKSEAYRKEQSYWPSWPDWMGIAVVGGLSAIFLGPELLVAYGLTGSVGLIDIAFACWQISDLVHYAQEGSQVFTATMMADAWIGHRIKQPMRIMKMLAIAIVEGTAIREVIMYI